MFFACCGAGGTGKTATAMRAIELIKDDSRFKGIEPVFMPSIVRGFYAAKGLRDQAHFLALSPEERRPFQLDLLSYYYEQANLFIEKNHDKLIIADRSPFDHIAYTIQGVTDLTLKEYEDLIDGAVSFCKENVQNIFYFSYPTNFSTDVDSDPFRVAHPSQNLIIDGLMFKLLHNVETKTHVVFGNIDRRAYQMISLIFIFSK